MKKDAAYCLSYGPSNVGESTGSFCEEARAALTHGEKYALFYPLEFLQLQFSIDDAPLGVVVLPLP